MLIILAGPFGSGKTYLLKNLLARSATFQIVQELSTRFQKHKENTLPDTLYGCSLNEVKACDIVFQISDEYYGINKANIDEIIANSQTPIIVSSVRSVIEQLKTWYQNSMSVYISPNITEEQLIEVFLTQGQNETEIAQKIEENKKFPNFDDNRDIFDIKLINNYDYNFIEDFLRLVSGRHQIVRTKNKNNQRFAGMPVLDSVLEKTDHLNIYLTHRCNRKCYFCINRELPSHNGEFISREIIDKGLLFAKENGIKRISFFGGEPTLHPHIVEFSKLFKDNGFETSIYTNADFPDVLQQLDGLVDNIRVSYYKQEKLPKRSAFKHSRLILHVLLMQDYISNMDELDAFIDKYGEDYEIVFSTPLAASPDIKNLSFTFFDELAKRCKYKEHIMHDGLPVQIYRGCLIKRNDAGAQGEHAKSLKLDVDGNITTNFDDKIANKLVPIKKYNEKLYSALKNCNNEEMRQRIWEAFSSSSIVNNPLGGILKNENSTN